MSDQFIAKKGVAIPMVSTTFEIPGYKIIQTFGVVRGITVRSRSVIGNLGASIQMIFGGNISIFSELCEQARSEAFLEMINYKIYINSNDVNIYMLHSHYVICYI
jgi:uncharacterized protein YbjQ (UPF0145 family)